MSLFFLLPPRPKRPKAKTTAPDNKKRHKLVKVERPRLYPMLVWTNPNPPKQIHRYVWVEDSD